jgi:hypothetical protein
MWRTSQGERTLVGAEAKLVRAAVAYVWDILRDDEERPEDAYEWAIPVFDGLQIPQKIVLLAQVGRALLRPEVAPPKLSAINEATIGALFETIRGEIQFEMDCAQDDAGRNWTYWRGLVRSALEPGQSPVDDPLPDATCNDLSEWNCLVESLADGILWDDDWQDESFIMDAPPELAAARRRRLAIAEDYYTDIAPDPTAAELAAAKEALAELVRG